MTVTPTSEYATLYSEWMDAIRACQQSYGEDALTRADEYEQRTYDALIEYVDEHDLTYTSLDPRGEE